MKKILRILILIFVLWNFDTFSLFFISPVIGGIVSYLTIFLLLVYFILFVEDYGKPLFPFLLLGISYYTIGGLNFTQVSIDDFLKNYIKYILVVLCFTELVKDTKIEEIYILFLFGAGSILIHAVFFSNTFIMGTENYGRYSGFYLNPNAAGSICLYGFSLSYIIKNTKLKLFGQLLFSLAGLLTMSRYFILIWVLINIIAVVMNRKNLVTPVLGSIALIFVLVSGTISLNSSRFGALESLFNDEKVKTKVISNDSRTETWATYTDIILDKPFFGNGYPKLHGNHFGLTAGVHNFYLLILGEAGIIPFFIILWIVFFLITKAIKHYKNNLSFLFLTITITSGLLVAHTGFDNFKLIFMMIFLYLNFQNLENRQINVNKPTLLS
ncbi:O-antigen ligase family protein [Algibacter mikhailovii]|uniref:O-antigen ligase-related domain-containing protein n=1 Tax=Algibacter mikhailovii TaxID=425498 RepID=A0A918V5B4_9FLAO|nr:O-antigen ligase family protein [Algibacter mikhailovii]GGZ70398.1 hypothetical protein GCM10007028_04390 [Algibacter mikhailovii]